MCDMELLTCGRFADVGPQPPPGHVARRGIVAVPALPGWGPVHRRDADGALESVRMLLERLLTGVSDAGGRTFRETCVGIVGRRLGISEG